MNTDRGDPPDLLAGSIALDALGSAASHIELCAAMEQLGVALCLPHFVLLHLHGPHNEVAAVLHNLPGKSKALSVATHKAVMQALSDSSIPHILAGKLSITELEHSIAAKWTSGNTTCMIVMGRPTAWEAAATTDLLGIMSLASSYVIDTLASTLKAECPFTPRELECLAFAAAGSSAKETSLHLGLSPRTVEEYLSRCKERLGIRSTLAAAATAVRRGWISYEEINAASQAINPRYGASQEELR